MNIGLFTETYYPEINGVASSVYALKEELERMGHNVYVFTTTSPGAPEHEKNVYRVHSLPCVLITDRRVGLFYQRKIASKIKRLKLDIIHTNTEFSLGIFGRIMARELKIPVVHTYHTIYEDYTHYVTKGIVFDNRVKRMARVFSKVSCNRVSEVIVPTDKVKRLLQDYHVDKEIRVIPTGIDLEKFNVIDKHSKQIRKIRENFGISEKDKVILFVGRISYEKNIDEIFDYLPEFLKRHTDSRFVLVGDGPEFKYFEKRAKESGCEDSIILMGERPYDEIQKYYLAGDVFVSASSSETQGLTFIEAMAAGLPVVAKQDECLDGILEPGKNGFFFRNKEEFHEALEQILYRKNGVNFEENARITAYDHSTRKFAKSVLSVYEDVLGYNEEMESLQQKG